jgi:transglutaminase-like putative cysteine protease
MTFYQIPRNSLAWMLVSQIAVILPHVTRLPIWVVLVVVGCVGWRTMVYQGRWSYPGRWTKVGFVLIGLVGIPLGYKGRVYGLEPAVSLLVVAYVLKLLEMHQKRDAYVVILLGYFVAITEFLFFQTIPYTLYMLAVVTMITASLVGLNQTQTHVKPLKTLKIAVVLLGQALPLMLVMFVLFPRISPLWSIPLQSQTAKTGVTDSMSPGDIAALSKSDGLAFKATFKGEPPRFSQLYWRGLVFSKYKDGVWTRDDLRPSVWRYRQAVPGWVGNIESVGKRFDYSVILEPTHQNWLFALAATDIPEDRDVALVREHSLVYIHRRGVTSKFSYELTSYLDYRLDVELDPFFTYRNTLLPTEGNPESRLLAERVYAESTSNEDYIRRILTMYNTEEFVYTLQPGALGRDDIDDFLFSSKRGFCEHYSGSFTFLMRAAGIPARVVVGYHGGEYNPNGNYVAVHQFDAHSWTEVWLEGKGWVRVDPTMAVAPDRIERGIEAAVASENSFLSDSPLSLLRYRQLLWLTEIRLQLDAVGHYWDTWVVGYTPAMQSAFLSEYLGDVDGKRLGATLLAAFFSVLGMVAIVILMRRSTTPLPELDREYLKFCRSLEKEGLGRNIGEGPLDYAKRIGKVRPDLIEIVDEVTRLYVDSNYKTDTQVDLKVIKKAIRAVRLKVLT